ncbi:Grim reaper [Thalictrum thalictroides]|uniref:Grim reaper n=1 Tax=Thalictrum thalictroides TaxID=46969 RepID=A0A7J6WUC2_THATH|nr:Grim reaper [Thalictrum thalictroides]
MASVVFLKHTTTCFVIIISLLLFLQCCADISTYADEDEEYSIDDDLHTYKAKQGNQCQHRKIRKGAHCDPITKNICNRLSVNNGTGILNCCKTHCRNILGDRNNCGQCGHKCGFGELCCNGSCTNVACNVDHCGKCNDKCLQGVRCEYGTCGYA